MDIDLAKLSSTCLILGHGTRILDIFPLPAKFTLILSNISRGRTSKHQVGQVDENFRHPAPEKKSQNTCIKHLKVKYPSSADNPTNLDSQV